MASPETRIASWFSFRIILFLDVRYKSGCCGSWRECFLAGGASLHFYPAAAGRSAFARRELMAIVKECWSRPGPWILWGTVGFGLFYLPITFAASWAPAWLVAGGWQITIVMGSLVVPFVGKRRVPWWEMWPSLIILAGVGATEWMSRQATGWAGIWALVPILVGAIAYPLGNRKMMQHTRVRTRSFSVYQRTFGMTLGSMPFWIVAMVAGQIRSGWPSAQELGAAAAVALLSGFAAALMFFQSTDFAHGDVAWLTRIEAVQSLEILFTVLLASLLFHQKWPNMAQWMALGVIMCGMLVHSLRPIRVAKRAQTNRGIISRCVGTIGLRAHPKWLRPH